MVAKGGSSPRESLSLSLEVDESELISEADTQRGFPLVIDVLTAVSFDELADWFWGLQGSIEATNGSGKISA